VSWKAKNWGGLPNLSIPIERDDLHLGNFGWKTQQCRETDYTLVASILEVNGYHWKAVYVKAGHFENCQGIRQDVIPLPPIGAENPVSACSSKTKLETSLSHVARSSVMSRKASKSLQKVKKVASDNGC